MQRSKTFKLFSYTEDRCNVRISCSISKEGIFKNNITFTNNKIRDNRNKSFSLFLSHEDRMYTNIRLKIGAYGNILNPGQIYQKLISDSQEYELNMKEHRKKYREENKDTLKENSKKYEQNNKDKIKKRKHNYYVNNKVEILKRIKKYQKNNPEKISILKQSRRGWGEPILINKHFKGCHIHHTHRNDNHQECICIPAELHRSVRHTHTNIKSMNNINKLAFEWLEK